MGHGHLCRLSIRVLGPMAVLWAAAAWCAQEEPTLLAPAPELKFQKRASYVESSVQQGVLGIIAYSVTVRVTPEGGSEVFGGPLVRPLKGLEIGLERAWGPLPKGHTESLTPDDPRQFGAEFNRGQTDSRPQPLPVHLGQTGPVKYELHGSRLKVKYYIDEHTVLSMRARYNSAQQTVRMWLSFERRF